MSQDSARRKFPAALPNSAAPAAGTRAPEREDATEIHLALVPPAGAQPADAAKSTVLHTRLPEMGVLDAFMRDPDVSEIMVNDIRNIMIEKDGKVTSTRFQIKNVDELNRLVSRLLQGTGRMLTPDLPYVDFMLPDGSRVNIVGPPIVAHGPCITIRKFPQRRLQLKDLVAAGTLDVPMAQFLAACVQGRINLLIAGGTGSGKTTLLNALGSTIPSQERIVAIEDTPELAFGHANLVMMQSKAPGPNNAGVNARELVANAMRMRPDRIIVGECRRAEAFDMLQAMNTGHAGSMTTVHANSARDALSRIETLCLLGGVELPLLAVRKQMANAIDLVIQIQRLRSGRRRVLSISEVTGLEGETVLMQEIFTFESETGTKTPSVENGRHRPTGLVPTFLAKLREHGVEIQRSWFGA